MDVVRIAAALWRAALLLLSAAAAALVVGTTFAASLPAEYESRALVDVARLPHADDAFSNSERADRTVANELVVAASPAVAEDVASELEGTDVESLGRSVSIEQLPGTDNIGFTATSEDAALAAETATAYAVGYVEARLARQAATSSNEADVISRELAVLREQLAALPQVGTAQAEAREEALQEQYVTLLGRELELRGSSGLDSEAAQLVVPAPLPESPAGPPAVVWGLVAALLTAVLGSLVAALLSRARDPVERRSDVEEVGLEVIAEVAPASRFKRSPPMIARGMETLAVNLTTRQPRPEVVVVLSVDVRDDTEVFAALVGQLRQQVTRVLSNAQSMGAVVGDSPSGADSTPRIELLGNLAVAGGATDLRSLDQADLVLLVVYRGNTRRADLVRVLGQIEQLTSGPRAALLVH